MVQSMGIVSNQMVTTMQATIEKIPLFSGLAQSDIEAISRHAVVKTYPRNAVLINEGDESDSLYVILSGTVKVFLSDAEGKEIILNTQGVGEYFGELALMDDAPRSASVMTLEDCKLSIICKKDFEEFLTNHPQVAIRVIKGLTGRLRTLTANVKSLALMDVYGRVARTLLNLATDEDGKLVIHQKLTQRDIANMVGASREMVSRILRDLSTGGYITIERKHITINEKLPPAW